MGDLISRKALLDKSSRNSIYGRITNAEGKNVLEIVQEQPTAFDLESVFKYAEKMAIEKMGITEEQFQMNLEEYFGYLSLTLYDVSEILHSAINATNGKIGGHNEQK